MKCRMPCSESKGCIDAAKSLSTRPVAMVRTCFIMNLLFFSFIQNAHSALTFQLFSAFGTNYASIRNPNAGLTQGTDGKLYGTTGYSTSSGAQIFTVTVDGHVTNLPNFIAGNVYPC